jgi:hypothetical protein
MGAEQGILLVRRRAGMEWRDASVARAGHSQTHSVRRRRERAASVRLSCSGEKSSRSRTISVRTLAEQVGSAQRGWRLKQLADFHRATATSTRTAFLT